MMNEPNILGEEIHSYTNGWSKESVEGDLGPLLKPMNQEYSDHWDKIAKQSAIGHRFGTWKDLVKPKKPISDMPLNLRNLVLLYSVITNNTMIDTKRGIVNMFPGTVNGIHCIVINADVWTLTIQLCCSIGYSIFPETKFLMEAIQDYSYTFDYQIHKKMLAILTGYDIPNNGQANFLVLPLELIHRAKRIMRVNNTNQFYPWDELVARSLGFQKEFENKPRIGSWKPLPVASLMFSSDLAKGDYAAKQKILNRSDGKEYIPIVSLQENVNIKYPPFFVTGVQVDRMGLQMFLYPTLLALWGQFSKHNNPSHMSSIFSIEPHVKVLDRKEECLALGLWDGEPSKKRSWPSLAPTSNKKCRI